MEPHASVRCAWISSHLRDFSIITANQRSLVWWRVFIVCSREGPWASRNMSSAILPRIVA
jgi:hypothetical protein